MSASHEGKHALNQVLLLHGLWMGPWALLPLSRRLQAAGFEVDRLGYASVRADPEKSMDALSERLRDRPAQHVVAHSLGGLIALQTLRREPDLSVHRVVCLGSPLCGSRAATGLSRWGFGQKLLGRSADLLRNGVPAWTGTAQIGLIAGTLGMGAGRLLADLKAPHDGTVEVEETRLQGLADHRCLSVSHTGLLASAEVARQVSGFLQEGRFVR